MQNGAKVLLFNRDKGSVNPPQACASYSDTLARLDLRVGRITEVGQQKMAVDFGRDLGVLTLNPYPKVREGQRVIRLCNAIEDPA